MPLVTIYEDNAGRFFLHAEGGSVLYEGGVEGAHSEARYVEGDPDGLDPNWSREYRHPWNEETQALMMDPSVKIVATYEAGSLDCYDMDYSTHDLAYLNKGNPWLAEGEQREGLGNE